MLSIEPVTKIPRAGCLMIILLMILLIVLAIRIADLTLARHNRAARRGS
jgi:hypothetical protein